MKPLVALALSGLLLGAAASASQSRLTDVRVALNLATQGGAMLTEVMDGDLIGKDQRGTGDSVPSLRTTVR